MTPDLTAFPDRLLNQMKFSSCSILAFKKFLLNSNLSNVSQEAACLLNKPKQIEELETKDALTGLIWNADDQCKMIYGQNASFCQVLFVRYEIKLVIQLRIIFEGFKQANVHFIGLSTESSVE
jgi:hypothetical protein